MITARVLGPEGRGILAIIVTWSALFTALVQLPISDAIVLISDPKSKDSVEASGLYISRALSILLATLCGVTMYFVMSRYEAVPVVVASLFAFSSSMFGIIGDVYRGILRSRGKFFLLQAFYVSQPLIYCGLCLFSFFIATTVNYFIISQVASIVLIFAIRGIIISIPVRDSLDWCIGRRLLAVATPLHVSAVVRMFTGQADRFAVVLIGQPEAVGQYAVAITLSSLFGGVFSTAIRSVALPALVNRTDAELSRIILRVMKLTWLASIVGTVVTCLFAPVAAPLLFGKAFVVAGTLASYLAIAYVFTPVKDVLFEACKLARLNRVIITSHIIFISLFTAVAATQYRYMGVYAVIVAFFIANSVSLVYVSERLGGLLPAVRIRNWILPSFNTLREGFTMFAAVFGWK
ncbi:oligosaccharide flippase family protein [Mesorhizobium sp. M1405]